MRLWGCLALANDVSDDVKRLAAVSREVALLGYYRSGTSASELYATRFDGLDNFQKWVLEAVFFKSPELVREVMRYSRWIEGAPCSP